MIIVEKGTTLDASNPLLEFFAAQDGKLVDLFALSFTIWNVEDSNVGQIVGPQVVDVSSSAGRISQGRYFAAWAVPSTLALRRYEIRWSYQFTSTGPVLQAATPFQVAEGPVVEPHLLAGFRDLEDEGLSRYPDSRLLQALKMATERIQRITDRKFFPQAKTLTLNGLGTQVLPLTEPIIAVESIRVQYFGTDFTDSILLDATTYKVFSRHVSQDLKTPNDLQNPKIEIILPLLPNWQRMDGSAAAWWDGMKFPRGSQNIQITGVFGATEWDGSPTGRTPEELAWCCQKLAMAFLPKIADTSGAGASAPGPVGPMIRLKTDAQEAEWSGLPAGAIRAGMLTGNADIDDILLSWRRPPYFGAA